MPMRALVRLVCVALLALSASAAHAQPRTVIVVDPADKAAAFGAVELSDALARWRVPVTIEPPAALVRLDAPNVVAITTNAGKLRGQGYLAGNVGPGDFWIHRESRGATTRWWVLGADAAGAMYGALELAEVARIDGHLDAVRELRRHPAIEKRGIKFNIPLDARTPSYSDDSTSAQANIPEMWDMAFWTRFLDEMARHRYNTLSLWSLSPFPSLVKVPEYPNVALADVKRKTGAMFDATNQGRNMYDPSWPLETVRTMTIDDKIAFWRAVMQHAQDRGIEVSLFTWNIFVYGTEGSGYGLTVDPANPVTKDYVRRSTRALFDTYPLLSAIGITSGENMGNLDDAGKERWMWESYGLGVQDAIANARDPKSPFHQPTRRIRLIHRAHQADLRQIVEAFKALPGSDRRGREWDSTLSFSFKYSQAHMHGTTAPRFIFQNGWFASIPAGKHTWLTVRNDDLYYLRWGDPDFVRAYWKQLPNADKIAGFMLGPDGYTWGRDFVSKRPSSPRRLVIEKQWYRFMLWGRLAYDPSIPNERFVQILDARFPGGAGSAGLRRVRLDVEDPAARQPLLLGLLRLHVVPRRLVEPGRVRVGARLHHADVSADARGRGRRHAAPDVGEGVRRRRAAGRAADAAGGRRSAGPVRRRRCPTDQHRAGCIRARIAGHDRRHPRHGGARALLRRQDPRRRRARALRTGEGCLGACARPHGAASVSRALARLRAAVERAERRQRLHAAGPDAGRHDGDPGGGRQGHPRLPAVARGLSRGLSRG